MFFTHTTLLCTFLTVSSVFAQDPSATASADPAAETSGGFTQCAPANLTFDGGLPPYTIDVLHAGDSNATPLTTVNAPASPYSWLVNVASGTNITLRATDSNGSVVDTNPVVVKPGSDASCLSPASAPARLARRQAPSPSATAVGGDDFFDSYFENAIAGLPTDSATSPEGAEAFPQETVDAEAAPTESGAVEATAVAVDSAAEPSPTAEPEATTVTSLSPESLSSLTGGIGGIASVLGGVGI